MRSFLRIAFVFAPVFLDVQQAFTQGSGIPYTASELSMKMVRSPLISIRLR